MPLLTHAIARATGERSTFWLLVNYQPNWKTVERPLLIDQHRARIVNAMPSELTEGLYEWHEAKQPPKEACIWLVVPGFTERFSEALVREGVPRTDLRTDLHCYRTGSSKRAKRVHFPSYRTPIRTKEEWDLRLAEYLADYERLVEQQLAQGIKPYHVTREEAKQGWYASQWAQVRKPA